MKKDKDLNQDETLLVALEQLGTALDMMQCLFARIEAQVAGAPEPAEQAEREHAPLTPDIPDYTTVH